MIEGFLLKEFVTYEEEIVDYLSDPLKDGFDIR